MQNITKLAHEHGCMVIVDSVTGLVGSELRVDEWEIDTLFRYTKMSVSASRIIPDKRMSEQHKNKI